MEELNSSAIVVLYPNGVIEDVKLDNRKYHIQYLLELIERSDILKRIVKERNIQLPKNTKYINESTYTIDLELAKDGIIILHNFVLDDESLEGYYITLPGDLSEIQKDVLKAIFENIDIHDNRFGIINDNDFLDIEPEEVQNMIGNKTK